MYAMNMYRGCFGLKGVDSLFKHYFEACNGSTHKAASQQELIGCQQCSVVNGSWFTPTPGNLISIWFQMPNTHAQFEA